jgi:hypothetical protein
MYIQRPEKAAKDKGILFLMFFLASKITEPSKLVCFWRFSLADRNKETIKIRLFLAVFIGHRK